jgi:hypothetical protein
MSNVFDCWLRVPPCRVAFAAGGAWWDAYDVQVIWTLTPLRIARRPA